MIKVRNKHYLASLLLFMCIGLFIYFLYYDFSNIQTVNSSININENEVPYISTYYIKPIVSTYEDVIIDFYITDYYQTEYQKEDYSNTFTVTVKINGKKDIVKKNLKAGDHSINIGKFKSTGEQKFSIIVTDEYGRNSHELFNYFLVKDETIVNEYIVTKNDLLKYNIKSTDDYEEKQIVSLDITDPTSEKVRDAMIIESKKYTPSSNTYLCLIAEVEGSEFNNWWGENIVLYAEDYDKDYVLQEATNTREGLQKLLNDKKAEGYNKVTLYPGVYRIDHLKQIYIPTEFTLNLNGSTIKQNQFTGDSSLMIELNNTFDSHVINGTLEGDYYSHDYINSPNSSEWVMGISIGGESKYSSYENLTIKDITGYGATNGISRSEDNSLDYTYLYPIAVGDSFKLGDIDRESGLDIDSNSRTTSDFINIDNHYEVGYLSISRYLGYQGRAFDSWNLICHFYDKDKNYIKSTDGYQYRRIEVPEDARYIKITILTTEIPTDLSIQYFRIPTNCSIRNVKFENCRSVALAPAAMNNMLVESCEFINSGQSITNCAFDAEDGWDLMQDCTFRKLNFHDNPKAEFLTAAGHNFIIEDMIDGSIYLYPRTNSYVLRNCNSINISRLGRSDRVGTGYTRIYNNIINYSGNLEANDIQWPTIIKDCLINGTTFAGGDYPEQCTWLRCDIGNSLNTSTEYATGLGTGKYIDSYIHDKYGYNVTSSYTEFNNCTLENIKGGFAGDLILINSKISNFECTSIRSDLININVDNCTVNKFSLDISPDYLKNKGIKMYINNSSLKNSMPLLKLQYYQYNDIKITDSNIESNSEHGLINFTGWDNTDNLSDNPNSFSILNSKLSLPHSPSIIYGENENTTTINTKYIITFKDNILSPSTLNITNLNILNSLNIEIIQ